MGSRPKDAKIYVTPAPGAYESCDTNQYKPKAPGFSLSTRYVVPSDVAMKPGPGAYTPEKVSGLILVKKLHKLLTFASKKVYLLITDIY